MDDVESALRMLDSMESRLTEVTVELIHKTVILFSRREVIKYLRDYDSRHNFSTEATREANRVEVFANAPVKTKERCTETVCHGPHSSDKCWSKPQNFKERDDFLARRRNGRPGWNRKAPGSSNSSSQVRGMKKVGQPLANTIFSTSDFLSLNAEFHDLDLTSNSTTSPIGNMISFEDVTQDGPSTCATKKYNDTIWALQDTGATHHMFNNKTLFMKGSLRTVENSNRRLKLAGGDVSLAVESIGKIRLKAGDGTVFKLVNCLYVPNLRKNLISGGNLKKKGTREVFDDSDPNCFALVIRGLALLMV